LAREKILAVEDDENILELLEHNLTREGYQVITVTSGEEALERSAGESPDLILLDLMLPGIDGLEVCRALGNDPKTQTVPVIMVTAKGEESDIVAGLELGAADYVVKPFSPRVLVARIRAVLRRLAAERSTDSGPIKRRDLVIDPDRHRVTLKGDPVELTATEFRILAFLARRPGWVFTRYQIVDAAHGEDYPVTDRSVDVHIVALRRKLGEAGRYIETVRGVGYRFME